MTMRRKLGYLAAAAFVAPVLAGLSAGSIHAAPASQEASFYIRSGQRLLDNNDLKGAEIQFRNAAQRAPQDGEIRLDLAEIYLREGDVNAAVAELIAAKQRNMQGERYDFLRADVLFRTGDYGTLLREIPAATRTPAVESMVRTK